MESLIPKKILLDETVLTVYQSHAGYSVQFEDSNTILTASTFEEIITKLYNHIVHSKKEIH